MSLNTGNAILSNAITVDGSYRVGIGTSTPDIFSRGYTGNIVGISATTGDTGLEINGGTSSGAYIDLGAAGTRRMGIISTATESQLISLSTVPLVLKTNSVTALTINSSQAATFASSVTAGGSITTSLSQANSTDINVTNTSSANGAMAQISAINGGASQIDMVAFGSGSTGTLYGITKANLKVIRDNSLTAQSNGLAIGTDAAVSFYVFTNSTERMRIRNDGFVFIKGTGTTNFADGLGLDSDNSTGYILAGSSTTSKNLSFAVNGTASGERMRITSGGIVCINTASGLPGSNKLSVYNTDAGPTFANATTTQQSLLLWNQGTTGNNLWTEFHTESSITFRGSIYYNRGSGVVVYGTSSDYRIKSEIEEFNALDIINNLKPKKFKINDAEQKSYGFIAHELQEFVPQAVIGEKDELKEDGTPKLQQVDYAQLTGLLTKAIQELSAKVTALENR